jgi:hypothetical protein
MASNLPPSNSADSSVPVKNFFDKFFTHQVTFPSNQIDATVGFFLKRDFDLESSRTVSIVLLNQARLDGVNVFELLDTMKSLTNVQLNQIVAQVLNASREKTSVLGFRVAPIVNKFESRNILI